MKVLSLFDGISCGMVALERAGIEVEKYVAYEIDEDAIKVSKHNYPFIEHKGDVFEARYIKGEFDLLIGGSPCTHWSIARGGNNRETKPSGIGFDLFMQYVRALEEVKPKYFLYENNESMSDDIKNEITKRLGVEPIMINSADFSAQSRKRYYWTNIPVDMNYKKSNLVFKDIEYKHNYTTGDFSKYADSVKIATDGSSVRWDTSGKGWYSQHSRARNVNFKMTTVTTGGVGKIYLGDYKYRALHPIELERLQTLPDNYTDCLSAKTRRAKCVGNGWTINVITHILNGMKDNGTDTT